MNLLITQFSPLPCCLVPVRPKYFPKHLILKHPQLMFRPQHETPSFTHIQDRKKTKSYILIFVLSDSKLKDKRLRNCGRHPPVQSVLFMVYLTSLSLAQVRRFVNNSSEMCLSTYLNGFMYQNITRLIYNTSLKEYQIVFNTQLNSAQNCIDPPYIKLV